MLFWEKMSRGKEPVSNSICLSPAGGDITPTLRQHDSRDIFREMKEAVVKGDVSAVSALIKEEPKLALERIHSGDTALYLAVREGHKELAELLLANNANVNIGSTNETPLRLAVGRDQRGFVEWLLANGADVNPFHEEHPFYQERASLLHVVRSREVGQLLLAKGLNAKFTGRNVSTPLHHAAEWGYLPVVDLFLANGASVDAEDVQGQTPLYLAASRRHKEVVELLLLHGADINPKDNQGFTPYLRVFGEQWDRIGDSPSGGEMLNFLREHGGH